MEYHLMGILASFFLVFLVCRELVCWYCKINTSVKLLKEIRDELQKIGETK